MSYRTLLQSYIVKLYPTNSRADENLWKLYVTKEYSSVKSREIYIGMSTATAAIKMTWNMTLLAQAGSLIYCHEAIMREDVFHN